MSRSKFSRRIFALVLALSLTISGALLDNSLAAEKDKDPKPKEDIRVKIAASSDKKTPAATTTTPVTNKRAAPAPAPAAKDETGSKPTGNKTGITNVRWSSTTDAVTGEETFRIVLDTSKTVKVQNSLAGDKLTVIVKGVQPGELRDIDFGSTIVKKAVFSAEGKKDTKIVLHLSGDTQKENTEVFTLKKNIEPGKPFRVVINVVKPAPLPEFSFTSGLKNKIIVLDPGHGGSDSGASGPAKTQEKTVNLAVAQKVQSILEKEGATVLLTRTNDKDVSFANSSATEELGARVSLANAKKADIFVSIHSDAFTNQTAGGTSTYYHQKTVYDSMLAKSLLTKMIKAGGLLDRRANASNLYVVKYAKMPAALVELAFISNPNEEKLLNSSEFQQKMAQAIVDGMKDFFDQAAKISGRGGKA